MSALSRQNNGFTLIEVIIATFLLALIAVICGLALKTGLDVYHRVNKYAREFESTNINYYRLFNQLSHVCNYVYKNKNYVFFQGESNSLSFVSTFSLTQPGIPGFFKVKYSLNQNKLQVKEVNLLDVDYLQKDFLSVEGKNFLSNIDELVFKYYDQNHWVDSWHKNVLPKAIWVKIVGKEQIEFIVPVIIGQKIKK